MFCEVLLGFSKNLSIFIGLSVFAIVFCHTLELIEDWTIAVLHTIRESFLKKSKGNKMIMSFSKSAFFSFKVAFIIASIAAIVTFVSAPVILGITFLTATVVGFVVIYRIIYIIFRFLGYFFGNKWRSDKEKNTSASKTN